MARLEVDIVSNIAGLTRGLSDAQKQLNAFATKIQGIGKGLSLAVTLPIIGIGAAAIKSASDTQESFSKFDTIFKDVAGSAEKSFKTLRNEYGLSSLAAKTLLGDTGDLLTGFGFSQTAALDLATEVNKLAVDLASFQNFSGGAAGASQILTKALLGERDALVSLGIKIAEEDVQKQVAINTAKGLIFETERQAKAHATLELATTQSKNAIGDWSRTSGSFSNQMRLLRARLSDVSVEFGEVMLPLATKLAGVVRTLIERFSGLDEFTKKTIIIIAGLAASIGPLLIAFGTFIKLIPLINAGLVAMTGPIGLVVIAVTAATTLIILNFDEIRRNAQLLLLEIIDFAQKSVKAIGFFASAIPGLSTGLLAADLALQSMGESVAKSVVEGLGNKGANAVEEFNNALLNTKTALVDVGNEIVKNRRIFESPISVGENRSFDNSITDPTASIGINPSAEPINSFFDNVAEIIAARTPTLVESFANLNMQINEILESGIENTLGDFAFSIGEALGSGANVVKSAGAALLGGLASILNQLGQLAIGTGIAIAGIKKALATLNPAVAIGAGVALIALAGFVSSKARSLAGGMSGSGTGVMGQGGSFGGGGGNLDFNKQVQLVGEWTVSGDQLRYVIANSENFKN